MNSEEPTTPGAAGAGAGKRQGLVKVVVDTIRESIGDLGRVAGWWKPRERGF